MNNIDHETAVFRYAGTVLPQRKIDTLIIGKTTQNMGRLLPEIFGEERMGPSRQVLSLAGYAHGNTRRPPAASIDFMYVDARQSDLKVTAAHFGLAQECLSPRGRSVWLLPPEFLDSEFFADTRNDLSSRFTVTHIHQADGVEPFLVVWIGNASPTLRQRVVISSGGSTINPERIADRGISEVRNEPGWSALLPGPQNGPDQPSDTLSAHFDIVAGVHTGDDKFFILSHHEMTRAKLEPDLFQPVLPHPMLLDSEIIDARPGGYPDVDDRLMLLSTALSPSEIAEQYPNIGAYIRNGEPQPAGREAQYANREYWYSIPEQRPAPILFSSGASGHICFYLNRSIAAATAPYTALYPKPHLAKAIERNGLLLSQIWALLNQAIESSSHDIKVEHASDLEVHGLAALLGH